jgi:hypothetical protein
MLHIVASDMARFRSLLSGNLNVAEINLALNLSVIQNLALAVFASAEPYFKNCDKIAVEIDKDVVSLQGFGRHVRKEYHLV